MGTKERPVDAGTERARTLVSRAGIEIRTARRDRGLSLRDVGRASRLSESTISRIERGLVRRVSVYDLARLHAVVGLELSVRAYPGGHPLRDVAHVALLADFRTCLDPAIGWSTEVPMPSPGDLRAWDGFIQRPAWRYGVEAETSPADAQTLIRRLRLKVRDSDVGGVILVVRSTTRTRAFLASAGEALGAAFPVDGRKALARLRVGEDPGGSAIVVLPARRHASSVAR